MIISINRKQLLLRKGFDCVDKDTPTFELSEAQWSSIHAQLVHIALAAPEESPVDSSLHVAEKEEPCEGS